jgi:hypothetical protein
MSETDPAIPSLSLLTKTAGTLTQRPIQNLDEATRRVSIVESFLVGFEAALRTTHLSLMEHEKEFRDAIAALSIPIAEPTTVDLSPLVARIAAVESRPLPSAPAGRVVKFKDDALVISDDGKLALTVAVATAAIASGVQAGNLRWHGGESDFVFTSSNGALVPMDAPTVLAFGLAVLRG